MSIFLIRHGETPGNAERVVQQPETPLSERGLRQAELVGRRMAEEGVSRILTSDYARAAQTADAIRRATGAPTAELASLRERHYGELRGRPYTEVGEYILMEGYEPPGGESWEVFHARVDRAWEQIADAVGNGPEPLAVVTHGLVLYSLTARLLKLPAQVDEAPMRFGNTAVTVIDASPPWQVRALACIAHLDADTTDDGHSPSGG